MDVLTDGNNVYRLPGVRLAAPITTAAAASWPRACAAGLAQGLSLPETVNQAREPHGPGPQIRPAPGTGAPAR